MPKKKIVKKEMPVERPVEPRNANEVVKEFDSLRMVDLVKSQRAADAIKGISKQGRVENDLCAKGRAEGLKEQELYQFIYVGLGGLLNPEKAKINRANEKKAAKARASR